MRARPFHPRGMTLVQLLVVCVFLAVFYAAAVVVLMNKQGVVGHARQVACSANTRGMHQGMVLFAQNNNERYPLPSVLDKANRTLALAQGVHPTTKDTTSNIVSVLIYGTFFGPEICRCPGERNPAIRLDASYEYAAPSGAADPKKALWDPKFNADFTARGARGDGGHFSYAHLMPGGAKLARWSNTFQANEAVIGDRGPRIDGMVGGEPAYDRASSTLRMHGEWGRWAGNVAYNDNHVAFERRLWSVGDQGPLTYTDKAGAARADLLHDDEPDDAAGTNNFLGNFSAAGPTPGAFKSIWD